MAETIHSSIVSPGETFMRNQEFINILGNEVPKAISSFQEYIENDKSAYLVKGGLGTKKWDDTIVQLDLLNDFLSRYQENPEQFSIRTPTFNKKNSTRRVTFGEGIGKPIDKEGETQLSISFKDPSVNDEHEEAILSAGLSHKSSYQAFIGVGNYEKSSIQINSSHVYLDGDNNKKVIPYAGIIYNLSRTGIESFGVYYVDSAPFYISISKPINNGQFEILKNFVQSFRKK